MDTELMRTFLEVNKTRHFGRAADNLYLTQAAVSARIKQLEDVLGVALFTRARNNIQLSAEGERLVPHAETILTSWSRARQEVALKLEQKHQLNIGTTAGLWNYALQEKLTMIHQAMVDVALRAEAYTGEELLRLVQENVLDLVVLYEPAKIPSLIATPLGKLELVLASSEPGMTPRSPFNPIMFMSTGEQLSGCFTQNVLKMHRQPSYIPIWRQSPNRSSLTIRALLICRKNYWHNVMMTNCI